MDLFEDLPEPGQPSRGQGPELKRESSTAIVVSDQAVGSKLFSDLPEASAVVTTTTPTTTVPTTGDKRKSGPQEQKNGSVDVAEKKVCKGASGIITLKGYVAERQGERDEMQDAHTVLNDITQDCNPLPAAISRLSYFAVFDGHGGYRAARFAAEHLHQNLIRRISKGDVGNMEKMVKKCFVDAFKQTDDEFLKQASSRKPAWKDGSTATCILVVDNTLYIANLGDSRAVLCRINEESQNASAISLSKEHSPTQYEERMRIQKAGGNVRDGRVLGLLEVSRSIGDGQYKRCGVISTPDIKRCQLTLTDRFVLLACDGLFKVFTPEEAVTFALSCLEDEKIQMREGKSLMDARYEAACNRLAHEAVRRGSADNVTVVLVRIEQ